MTTVKNIYDFINSVAPFDTQEDWDNSGHLIGDFRKEVKKAVMALDCTKDVAQFAADVGADLVLTHHPAIFKPLSSVKKGSAVYTLLTNDIAQISAHTNFDRAELGINYNLANILDIQNVRSLDDSFIVVGELEDAMSIDDLAELVSCRLDVSGLRYTDTEKEIKTVCIGGGACEEYIELAMENSDCFITGDLKYHAMLDASEAGFAVISAGHYETENYPFLMLSGTLEHVFSDVEFIIAPRENPVKSI